MSKSKSIYVVQLVFTSPNGYNEDRYNTAATFSSEQRARLFVEWANGELNRIRLATLKLHSEHRNGGKELLEGDDLIKALNVPSVIAEDVPTHRYDGELYHFHYDGEYDLDPEFG